MTTKRKSPSPPQKAVHDVACPYCNAAPNDPCQNQSRGGPTMRVHPERRMEARGTLHEHNARQAMKAAEALKEAE